MADFMKPGFTRRPIADAVANLIPARQRSSAVPSKSRPARLPLGALMLAASASAWAQSNGTAPTEQVLPRIEVNGATEASSKESVRTTSTSIGKGRQDIRDIPQSITVMTEKLMNDAKLTTLKEALHYTGGITFAAAENGTDQDIRLRGFPVATTGDLLIDGMRDPSQYDRDTFNYDRIEVMRGSASMLFGRGSTGGVVNQVTKKPFLSDLNEVGATYGTGNFKRLTGDFNIKTGDDDALRLNVMRTKADNGGAGIDKYGIAPTYSWGIGSGDEFTVGLFHLNVDNVPMAGMRYLNSNVPDVKAGNFYGTQSDYLTGEATYGTLAHTHRFGDGGELRSQLRSGVFDRAQWSSTASYLPGTTGINDGTVLKRSGLSPRKDRYKGTYLQSDYSNKYRWFGLKHALLAGVDASREDANRYSAYGTIGTNFDKGATTIGNPNDGARLAASPTYRESTNYSSRTFGAYIQDLMQIAPHWKLLGGLRFDSFSGNFQSIAYADRNATLPLGVTGTHLSDSLLSYRTGVLYQPTASSSFHLSYGTSFNTSADTYQYVTAQTANTPPEKSRNIELGAKLDWMNGALSTRVALFRTEKYNERTTDSDFAESAYLLSGKRHSQGVELDIVGRLSPKWETYFSYSYIPSASIDAAGSNAVIVGSRVGLTPKNSGALWLSYQATSRLRIAAGLRGASENRPLAGRTGAASTGARAAGYMVGDAMIEYVVSPTWTAQLNVSNLTNRTYGDQLYPGFVITGPERTALLTLTTRF
jgi:catecholate siderophore receptor